MPAEVVQTRRLCSSCHLCLFTIMLVMNSSSLPSYASAAPHVVLRPLSEARLTAQYAARDSGSGEEDCEDGNESSEYTTTTFPAGTLIATTPIPQDQTDSKDEQQKNKALSSTPIERSSSTPRRPQDTQQVTSAINELSSPAPSSEEAAT
eukprot:766385-Hanusia_phi.AAC.3